MRSQEGCDGTSLAVTIDVPIAVPPSPDQFWRGHRNKYFLQEARRTTRLTLGLGILVQAAVLTIFALAGYAPWRMVTLGALYGGFAVAHKLCLRPVECSGDASRVEHAFIAMNVIAQLFVVGCADAHRRRALAVPAEPRAPVDRLAAVLRSLPRRALDRGRQRPVDRRDGAAADVGRRSGAAVRPLHRRRPDLARLAPVHAPPDGRQADRRSRTSRAIRWPASARSASPRRTPSCAGCSRSARRSRTSSRTRSPRSRACASSSRARRRASAPRSGSPWSPRRSSRMETILARVPLVLAPARGSQARDRSSSRALARDVLDVLAGRADHAGVTLDARRRCHRRPGRPAPPQGGADQPRLQRDRGDAERRHASRCASAAAAARSRSRSATPAAASRPTTSSASARRSSRRARTAPASASCSRRA